MKKIDLYKTTDKTNFYIERIMESKKWDTNYNNLFQTIDKK